jgi:twitching motility protein PilT
VHQVYSQMQVGQTKFGMQTFNQGLAAAVAKRLVTVEEAMGRTSDADELKNLLTSGPTAVRNTPTSGR